MSQYPTWAAGQKVTAALLQGMQTTYYTIGADVTNATTTLADTGLSFTPVGNSTWLLQLRAAYDAPTATDIQCAWSGPGDASMARNIMMPQIGTTSNENTAIGMIRRGMATQEQGGGPGGVTNGYASWWEDVILTVVTSGLIKFRFAAVSTGTATFRAASYFTALRIG